MANSIKDWVKEEEAKYQKEKMGKEIESFKLEKAMAEGPLGLFASAVKKMALLRKPEVVIFLLYFRKLIFTLSAETQICSEQNCMFFHRMTLF